jgi:hypothetical protein
MNISLKDKRDKERERLNGDLNLIQIPAKNMQG